MAGMPLRFPNPGSDIGRLVNTYRLIYRDMAGGKPFEIDDISAVLTAHLQASSSGAVGSEALARSQNADRSRDPLYNQSKMYTEIFRMLGWLRPAGLRSTFNTTLLGDLIAEDWAAQPDLVAGLLRECLLAVTFPNPATDNVGVVSLRPFRWLMLLAGELDGVITRHGMILGLLLVTDDQQPGEFEAALERVSAVRGSLVRLAASIRRAATGIGIQVNTLENYTRFPVGVLSSPMLGWGSSERVSGIYERPARAIVLTPRGRSTAERMRASVDVRESALEAYPIEERAQFAVYGYYAMLIRSGLDPTRVASDLDAAEIGARRILQDLGVGTPDALLYSPIQQAGSDVLALADSR
jgi:hypothetical protein